MTRSEKIARDAGDVAYPLHRDAGPEAAKEASRVAHQTVKAQLAVDEPLRTVVWSYRSRAKAAAKVAYEYSVEVARLRAERAELLSALAVALGTTETTAWQIVRLDMHDKQEAAA